MRSTVQRLRPGRGLVGVNRSVWRGKIQPTKSEHPDRCFALSPQLVHHLLEYLTRWTPNEKGWLFATRNGTPWDQNLVVKRKLQPLLNSLGIQRGGLHAATQTARSSIGLEYR